MYLANVAGDLTDRDFRGSCIARERGWAFVEVGYVVSGENDR